MNSMLYSLMLELSATNTTTLPLTTGHQTHALFLHLIQQIDLRLAEHLHDEHGYRPFTVSSLRGAHKHSGEYILREGQIYQLRITLLDGGELWRCLSKHMLEAGSALTVHLGSAIFRLHRILSTPASDPSGWARWTNWQTLATQEAAPMITVQFASPTAFSMGKHQFTLFPEPILVWDSLMRTWNRYAPEALQLEKLALREYIKRHVMVSDYTLRTTVLHFPRHTQKGFIGTCSYRIQPDATYAPQLAALAEFARYAGIGYKTTMGMGQARTEDFRKSEKVER